MTHVRTQIRERFASVLTTGLGAGYDVHASRKFTWNHVDGVALVDMKFLNDQTQEREVMGDQRTHVASLYIRIQRGVADETLLDDALDVDEVRAVTAIEGEDWSDLLEQDPELLQVNFSDDGSGMAMGALILRYDVEYRIDKSNPEQRIP